LGNQGDRRIPRDQNWTPNWCKKKNSLRPNNTRGEGKMHSWDTKVPRAGGPTLRDRFIYCCHLEKERKKLKWTRRPTSRSPNEREDFPHPTATAWISERQGREEEGGVTERREVPARRAFFQKAEDRSATLMKKELEFNCSHQLHENRFPGGERREKGKNLRRASLTRLIHCGRQWRPGTIKSAEMERDL